MWKHVLVQGCYQLFWLFFFMYALPTLKWERYWLTSECQLLSAGPVLAPQPEYCLGRMMLPVEAGGKGYDAGRAEAYCTMLQTCGWPCGERDRVGAAAACSAAVAAVGGGVFAPGDVPTTEKAALCPASSGGGCDVYWEYRRVEQFWEAAHEKQAEEDFKRVDSLLFNSFIFLQVGSCCGRRAWGMHKRRQAHVCARAAHVIALQLL